MARVQNRFKVLEKYVTCHGCGTCAGICPTGAIEMRKHSQGYFPFINDIKCTKCGLCLKVCPVHSRDLVELNKSIFGRVAEDALLGNYINCYVGHSVDKKIRYESASGGVATTLLTFALNEGIIDGAIVTKMKKNKPLEPEVFIARTKEEIVSASKSKYCPVPLNAVIDEILSLGGKFAVVGLPCHIHGIRKAESINEKLKKKLILKLGLFCGHTVSFSGTHFLLQRIGVRAEDVVNLDYRGEGWPGGMSVRLRDGSKKFLPQRLYWGHFFNQFFFTPIYCTLCSDALGELADISLGDAWLPELIGRNIGESMIITRTEAGEELIQSAVSKGRVKVEEVSRNDVIRAQRSILLFKKNRLKARASLLEKLGKQLSDIDLRKEYPRPSLEAYLSSTLTYLGIYASSTARRRYLLRYAPLKLLKLYAMFVNKL